MLDILHRVGIKASSKNVYDALATRDGLAGWWTTDTQGESKVGGVIKFRFSADGREIGGFDMKVLELRPAERVLWQVVDGPAEWMPVAGVASILRPTIEASRAVQDGARHGRDADRSRAARVS
jgi:uncharacterized protein YndB with AHSA1/START domain